MKKKKIVILSCLMCPNCKITSTEISTRAIVLHYACAVLGLCVIEDENKILEICPLSDES